MRFIRRLIFIICAALFVSQCTPSRFVKTLKKNEKAVSFSFGGPVIQYSGAAIPIPFSTFAFGYGLTDRITPYASLHTTSLLFGNLQSDLGATFRIYEKNKFGFSASPAIQIATSLGNKNTTRLWPSVDMNVYYHPKSKSSYVYAGINGWFELSGRKAHNEVILRNAIPNIQVGYTFVKTKWHHQFEFKYLGLGINNLPGVVGYIGINGKGSAGIYYSLIRTF